MSDAIIGALVGSLVGGIILYLLDIKRSRETKKYNEERFKIEKDFIDLQHKRLKYGVLLKSLSEYIIYARCILSKYLSGDVDKGFTSFCYPLHWTTLTTLQSLVKSNFIDNSPYNDELIHHIDLINQHVEFIWQRCYIKKTFQNEQEKMTDLEYYKKHSQMDEQSNKTYCEYYHEYLKAQSQAIQSLEKIEEILIEFGRENK